MQAERTHSEIVIDRVVRAVLRRWTILVTALLTVYAALPWLSPLLRSAGYERAGQAILRMYRTLCHQIPERSFQLNSYQVCYCHRCTALYTTLAVISLVYSVGRWRYAISRRWLLLLTLPMVIDGTWHLLDDILPWSLRFADNTAGSFNFWLRMITGTLFAIGVVLWGYPRLQREINTI